jgi:hypothetical protein
LIRRLVFEVTRAIGYIFAPTDSCLINRFLASGILMDTFGLLYDSGLQMDCDLAAHLDTGIAGPILVRRRRRRRCKLVPVFRLYVGA